MEELSVIEDEARGFRLLRFIADEGAIPIFLAKKRGEEPFSNEEIASAKTIAEEKLAEWQRRAEATLELDDAHFDALLPTLHPQERDLLAAARAHRKISDSPTEPPPTTQPEET